MSVVCMVLGHPVGHLEGRTLQTLTPVRLLRKS